MHGGVNPLHGQVGALDEADLDLAAAGVPPGRRPGGDALQGGEGVGQVGLQHDPRVEVLQLGLVEHAGEGPDGQLEVPVLLHVKVDEGRAV